VKPVPAPPSVFCDHNAGGPASAEVLAAFLDTERSAPGNPASSHTAGRAARALLEQARERIANALGTEPADVVFTSGGTEAANLAVMGLGEPTRPVLLAAVEHPAVAEPAALRGTVAWQVDADGVAVVRAPESAVGLVCLTHAQSELGTLQPVAAAAELAAALGVPLFVDAAQTLGRVDLAAVVASGAALSLSPHKAGGLRGHGVLLGRDLHRRLRPLLRGGGQELGLRPGTQSPALAVANALAIERAIAERAARAAAMWRARAGFLAGIAASGVTHRLLTPIERSLPNTAMLHFPGVDGRNLLPTLDLIGVQASHGSACSSGAARPPRVLSAIGLDEVAARACVRISLGHHDDPDTMHEVGVRVGATIARRQKKN
jgi:cysteine desulfurase